MPNAYEVLGVDPVATDDEIKAAYRARARALHPDHQTGRDPDAVRAAAREFSAVAAAWQVLSDPDRRRSYDAALRAASTSPSTSAESTAPASAPPPTTPRPAPAPVASRTSFRARHPRGVLVGILVAAVLAVGTVGAIFVAANQESTTAASSLGLPEQVTSWEAGNCVTTTAGGAPIPVPCSEPNDGVILSAAPSATDCPPDETDSFIDAPPGGWCVALNR